MPLPSECKLMLAQTTAVLRRLLTDGQIICKGPRWGDVPSREHGASKGEREHHLVARLCSVSVWQAVTTELAWSESSQRSSHSFPEPRAAGRRPKTQQAAALGHPAPEADSDECGGPSDFTKPDTSLASNWRIGLTLGRLAFTSLTSRMPAQSYTNGVLRAYLSGVPVGQKYHGKHALEALLAVGRTLLQRSKQVDFASPPSNLELLRLPACWSAATDGVTVGSGDTIMPTCIKYTNQSGQLVCVPVTAPFHGTSYAGADTAALLADALETALLPEQQRRTSKGQWQFWRLGRQTLAKFYHHSSPMPMSSECGAGPGKDDYGESDS